ncbi:MAG: AHH domain-containing protein [Bacteroidales bacterium]|nr:AHH domain-containing protein [Bacteroidales bacterium]
MALTSKDTKRKDNIPTSWGQPDTALKEPSKGTNEKETPNQKGKSQDSSFSKITPSQPEQKVKPTPNNFNVQLQPKVVTPKMNPTPLDADFKTKDKKEQKENKEEKIESKESPQKEFSISDNNDKKTATTEDQEKKAIGTKEGDIENKEKSDQEQFEQKQKSKTEETKTGKPIQEITDQIKPKQTEKRSSGEEDKKTKPTESVKGELKDKPETEQVNSKPVEAPNEETEQLPDDVILSLLDFVNLEGAEESASENEDSELEEAEQPNSELEDNSIQASFDENLEPTPDKTEEPESNEMLIGELAASINAKAEISSSIIQGSANKLKTSTWARAEIEKENISNKILGSVKEVSKKFDAKQLEISKLIIDSRKNIEQNCTDAHVKVDEKGKLSKEGIDKLFENFKTDVNTKVSDYVGKSNQLNSDSKERFRTEQKNQANEARNKGEQRAAIYDYTEKGLKQKNAVKDVANEVAKGIEDKIEDNLSALDEVTETIPEEFIKQGTQATQDIDKQKQPLYDEVDKQVVAMHIEVDAKMQKLTEALNEFEQKINADISTEKDSIVTKIKEQEEPASKNIDKIAASIVQKITDSSNRVITSINQTAEESVLILNKKKTGKKDNLIQFKNSVIEFYDKTASETNISLNEGKAEQSKGFGEVQKAIDKSIEDQENRADEILLKISEKSLDYMTQLYQKSVETFNEILSECDRITKEFHDGIKKGFDDNIVTLENGFKEVLANAKIEIDKSIQEGLNKNNEALAGISDKMTDAASDAAWRYDHSILAAIGDVLSFIGGLVLGILMIVVIVVVVIVAFKVIVAGLVAMGVSLIVAEIIVAVGGLVMLGVMAYSAYSARREQGESGWSAFFGALGDVTGITDIYRGITQPGLSPFDRGFFIGKGLATVATIIFGTKVNKMVNKGLSKLGSKISTFILKPKITNFGRRMRYRYPKLYKVNKAIKGFGEKMQKLGKQAGTKVRQIKKSITKSIIKAGKQVKKTGKEYGNKAIKYIKSIISGEEKIHHIASNKHLTKYTPQYESIAGKYDLKLDADWNKIEISDLHHYSNHPKEYHEFVLNGMRMADSQAALETTAAAKQAKFLQLFDLYVKQPLLKNPNMLNKTGWK